MQVRLLPPALGDQHDPFFSPPHMTTFFLGMSAGVVLGSFFATIVYLSLQGKKLSTYLSALR